MSSNLSTNEAISLLCPICCYQFTQDSPPKILVCGHTCCKDCLAQILATTKHCGFCRHYLPPLKLEDCPTNHAVVSIIEELPHFSYTSDDLKKRVLQVIQENMEISTPSGWQFLHPCFIDQTSTEILKKNIKWLQDLLEKDMEDACNLRAFLEPIEGVEKVVRDVSGIIFRSSNTLLSEMFDNTFSFIMKIYDLVAVEHKIVFACQFKDGNCRYAKISIFGNLLYLHALEKLDGLSNVSTYVDFDDFRRNLSTETKKKYGFLKLRYGEDQFPVRVIIDFEVGPTPNWGASTFLSFCSGELGESYKSHSYEQEYGAKLETTGTNPANVDKIIKFKGSAVLGHKPPTRDKHFIGIDVNDHCYLSCENDGSFEIVNFNKGIGDERVQFRYAGMVKGFPTLHNVVKGATYRKIIDCGIAFSLLNIINEDFRMHCAPHVLDDFKVHFSYKILDDSGMPITP